MVKLKIEKILRKIRRFWWETVTSVAEFFHKIWNSKMRIPAIVIAAVVLAGIVFVLLRFVFISGVFMDSQLTNFASQAFQNELKDRGAGSYTLNLDYLERNGYDTSLFNIKGCSGTGTYVIVNIDSDGNITNTTTNLDCN